MPPYLRSMIEDYANKNHTSIGEAGRVLLEAGAKALEPQEDVGEKNRIVRPRTCIQHLPEQSTTAPLPKVLRSL